LFRWKHLPAVLPPTKTPAGPTRGSWSGSGVVDWNNTAGFQSGKEKSIVLAWTAVNWGQCIAFSNDRGRTFTKWDGNPVVPLDPPDKADSDRDPKVFWHEPTKQWVMVFCVTGKGMAFYTSPDLKRWTQQSLFPDLFECPDFFELPVDGDANNRKWVLWDASGKYYLGKFDGKAFAKEAGPFLLDAGKNYYAAQTWSDGPAADGRRISIGWMRGGEFPGMPFNQQMGVPSVLTLKTLPEGVRLTKLPVKEIDSLREELKVVENATLEPGRNPLEGVAGDTFDIDLEIEADRASEGALTVRGEAVRYANGALSCAGKSVPLDLVDGRLKLRVLADRTSLEIYGNDGAVSMTSSFLPKPDNKTLSLTVAGGPAKIVSLKVYKVRSAWSK
jgi:sucrose-6-phosphate hydrolase SacC (GH32 family)